MTRRASPRPVSPRGAHAGITARHVVAAGDLYRAGAHAKGPLDRAFAEQMRKLHALDDEARAFAVETAQAMLRHRARIDHAARSLDFPLTMHARVCMFLAGTGAADVRALPGDAREIGRLVDAWRASESAPLAVRASIPAFVVEELTRVHPIERVEELCLSFTRAPPLTVRANTLRTTREALAQALADAGHDTRPTALSPDGLVVARRANVHRTRAFQEGMFEVQDEGSQLVSLLCEVAPGMTVVDGCAGAGGKTLHLAALMSGKGSLHAFDVHQRRLSDLRERAARAGAHNVRVHVLDERGVAVRAQLAEKCDVVLVDAPCSGSGVFRRNPDTSWNLTRADVDRMIQQQRAILADYAPLVRPGGALVYATCSVLPSENDANVTDFLAQHHDFALSRSLAVDPVQHDTDGFFAAVLTRR